MVKWLRNILDVEFVTQKLFQIREEVTKMSELYEGELTALKVENNELRHLVTQLREENAFLDKKLLKQETHVQQDVKNIVSEWLGGV